MSKHKISFIVIAYNEELAIASCVKSIVSQKDIKDYEIIIVNDGSRDKTREVVTELSKQYPGTINLVDFKNNKGRGSARSAGLAKSDGQYIAFVDADIILPSEWLSHCLKSIKKFDVVGGTAVPDGDVSFIYRVLQLSPKKVNHSTIVTGSNGFYRREVFDNIDFDRNLRNGEDVDLNHKLITAGYSLHKIHNLVVKHYEYKSFSESISWLFLSGAGSTKQLLRRKHIRLPDIAYFVFVFALLVSILLSLQLSYWFLLLPILYPLLTSSAHMVSKFQFKWTLCLKYALAIFIDYLFIYSYYLGRTYGFIRVLT